MEGQDSIQKAINDAGRHGTIKMLKSIREWEFPPLDNNFASIKDTVESLIVGLKDDDEYLPVAKSFLSELVKGYPACELASTWV
jgi:hypothetical protein